MCETKVMRSAQLTSPCCAQDVRQLRDGARCAGAPRLGARRAARTLHGRRPRHLVRRHVPRAGGELALASTS